ncbi:DUF4087 domain-containing protein [Citromicrobium bathyomarinum]|uniref:DUF4087 domain-containing protein n=1 Tax=Citromicrobium bathyomarinum TaxID=72174 RepID=UPI00315A3E1C
MSTVDILRRAALAFGALALLAGSPAPHLGKSETRCGWLINPTPANWWLIDAEGEWTIGEQGGYQAPGFDEAPWEGLREQVSVNGNYGYECVCMAVTSDPDTMTIARVISVRSKPLKACKDDPKLPSMDS